MAININKALDLQTRGLAGVSVTNPVARVSRAYFNTNDTVTLLVEYYQDQASLDDENIPAYEVRSYNITVPAGLDTLLVDKLKLEASDFDAVV